MYKIHISIEGCINILCDDPGKSAYLRGEALMRYGPDALELAFGGYWKTGLDDIDAETIELPCNSELLIRCESDPGGLLSITEGGIKNSDALTAEGSGFIENDPSVRILVS
jgi:hypothetical protein